MSPPMTDDGTQGGRDDATALCIACGLCCDGNLHDVAHLGDEEIEAADKAGLNPFKQDEQAKFELPCRAFDGRCQCYSIRPSVCRVYRCKLLRKLDAREIAIGDGLAMVEEARRLGAEVERGYEPGESPSAARSRWLTQFREQNPGANPGWYLAMTSYNLFLDRHFRGKQTAVMSAE